jgi:NADPH-dependent ferric siderophore reductase
MTLRGEVVQVRRLTPSMVRVVLGGDGLAEFTPTPFTDQYVNALFPNPGSERPAGRRYTIRAWDPETRQVTIDFVVHGDVGFAGRWADRAQPGDQLEIVGPTGAYAPDPAADWHLMVGDESALPAIAASLEAVPSGRTVLAVVVVDGPDHELELTCPGDLDLTWVHRTGEPEQLVRAVEALVFPGRRADVFVHGEAAEVRAVRRHLLADRGIPRDGASISPYWRRTMTDERWREVKREWLSEQELDVPA